MNNKAMAWRAWAGCMLGSALNSAVYGAIALFYDTILTNTGCSPTEYALLFTVVSIGLVLGGVITGKLLDINLKLFSVIGALGPVAMLGAISFAKSIFVLYAVGIFFGLTVTLCGPTLFNIAVAKWFNQGMGKVLSIGFSLVNGYQIIAMPLYASVIISMGANHAALAIGVVSSIVCVVMMLLVVPRFPEHYGLEPLNVGKAPEQAAESADAAAALQPADEVSLSASHAVRTPTFLFLFLFVLLVSSAPNIYYANSINLFQSFGVDYVQASLGTSIASAAAMALAPISGILIDKVGAKTGISIYAAVAALVCFLTPILNGIAGMAVFALLINFSQIWLMVGGTTVPGIFGSKSSSQLISWIIMAGSLAAMIFPVIGTTLYGATGSYAMPFIVCGVAIVIGIVLLQIALSDKSRESVKRLAMKSQDLV